MSNETLRQQLSKLKSKVPRSTVESTVAPMVRPTHKMRPRTIGRTPAPVAGGQKRPWTARAKEKVAVAKRAANSLLQIKSIHGEEFAKALAEVEHEAGSIRKKSLDEAQSAHSRELTAIRRNSETVLNLVKTIREGVSANDVELEHIPSLRKNLVGHLNSLNDSLIALEAPKVQRPDVKDHEHLLNEGNIASFRQRYERQLNVAINDHKNKRFFFIDQPVVPVFDGIVKSSTLLAQGLPVEDMAGYPVLLQQRLLVIDPERLAEEGLDRAEYVMKLLALLNKESKQGFMLVLEIDHVKRRNGLEYFWIMPSESYRIMTLAGGNQTSVRDWSLAF